MTDDRYIVVQGQGYYGPLYVAQDTQTGRLQHAPDYRYHEAQKVADHANEYWLLRQERQSAGDKVWVPVVEQPKPIPLDRPRIRVGGVAS